MDIFKTLAKPDLLSQIDTLLDQIGDFSPDDTISITKTYSGPMPLVGRGNEVLCEDFVKKIRTFRDKVSSCCDMVTIIYGDAYGYIPEICKSRTEEDYDKEYKLAAEQYALDKKRYRSKNGRPLRGYRRTQKYNEKARRENRKLRSVSPPTFRFL